MTLVNKRRDRCIEFIAKTYGFEEDRVFDDMLLAFIDRHYEGLAKHSIVNEMNKKGFLRSFTKESGIRIKTKKDLKKEKKANGNKL